MDKSNSSWYQDKNNMEVDPKRLSSDMESWLVAPIDGKDSLAEIAKLFQEDPEVTVTKILNLSDQSQILVVEMSEITKDRYEQEFEGKCRFERNMPLFPSGSPF